MKLKTVLTLVLVAIVGSLAAIMGAYAFFKHDLMKYMEQQASAAIEGNVELTDFTINSLTPLSVTISGLKMSSGKLRTNLQIEELEASVHGLGVGVFFGASKPDVLVKILRSKIAYKLVAKGPEAAPPSTPAETKKIPSLMPIGKVGLEILDLDLSVYEGDAREPTHRIESLNLAVSTNALMRKTEPIAIKMSFVAQSKLLPFALPVQMSCTQCRFDGKRFTAGDLDLALVGIKTKTSGYLDVETMDQDWSGQVSVPDLAQMPGLSAVVYGGKFSGSVAGSFRLIKKANEEPKASFSFQAKQVHGEMNHKKDGVAVTGGVQAELKIAGQYNQTLRLDQLVVNADLSLLDLNLPPYLVKPTGVLMKAAVQAKQAGANIAIEKSEFEFSQLKLNAAGSVQSAKGGSSRVSLSLRNSLLNGLEKYLIPLKDYPLKGMANAEIDISGDLFDFSKLQTNIKALNLNKVEGFLNFKKDDIDIKGPFRISTTVNGQSVGTNVSRLNAKVSADLTGMGMVYKTTINKKANQKMVVALDAGGNLSGVKIKNFQLVLPFLNLKSLGNVQLSEKPRLNLKNQIISFNLDGLKTMLPGLPPLPVGGDLSGSLAVSGEVDKTNFLDKSNLAVTGNIALRIPEFKHKSEAAPIAPGAAPLAAEPPKAIFPNWPLLANSAIGFQVALGQLQFNELAATGMQVAGTFARGRVSGSASIGKVFGGSINVEQFSYDGFKPVQSIPYRVKATGLAIKDGLKFLVPDFQESATGELSFQAAGDMTYPFGKEPLEAIRSSGMFSVKNAVIKSADISALIKEKIKEFPALSGKVNINQTDARIEASGGFDLKASVIRLQNFHLTSSDGNELKGSGSFKSARENKFDLQAWIANPKVLTDCKRLLDANQRLVLKSVAIKNMEWANVTEVLSGFVTQMAGCRVEQEIKKTETKVKKDIEKELGKSLQKGLKNLFGK